MDGLQKVVEGRCLKEWESQLEREVESIGPVMVRAGVDAVSRGELKEARYCARAIAALRRWLRKRGVRPAAWL